MQSPQDVRAYEYIYIHINVNQICVCSHVWIIYINSP